MNYVYAASATIIVIFISLILKKKEKKKSDYLLILINLFITCFLLADVLVNWRLTSVTVIFQNLVPLLLFPTFVYYVLQFTHSKKRIVKSWVLMFLPSILLLTLSFTDHFILNNYQSEDLILEHFNAPSIWYQLIFKGSQLLFIGIIIWLLLQLKQFEKDIRKGYSTIDTINLIWLRNFTWIYLGAISTTFVLFLSQNLGIIDMEIKQVFGLVYGILVCSIFYMNYNGIQHYTLAEVYQSTPLEGPTKEKNDRTGDIDNRKKLSINEESIEKEMLKKIESEKLYLDPKFTLADLAELMKQSTHLISKIINAKENRSFYDLINGYRVDHLKKLLDDPNCKKYTILALGLDSGFNSKASLNRIFKNTTGITPKAYLDKGLNS